jgi:hypothetical protein
VPVELVQLVKKVNSGPKAADRCGMIDFGPGMEIEHATRTLHRDEPEFESRDTARP